MADDPMEQMIADALEAAGIAYIRDGDPGGEGQRLDFYLPDYDLFIEVKRLHSPRIAEQMALAKNVIAVQGEAAVRWLAGMIAGLGERHESALEPASKAHRARSGRLGA